MFVVKTLIGGFVTKSLGMIKIILIMPFLIRYLGVEDYGIYMYIIATAGLFAVFIDIGLSEYTVTYYNNSSKQEKRQAIGLVYCTTICLSVIFMGALLSYTHYFDTDFFGISSSYIILTFILAIISNINFVNLAIAQYKRKLRKFYTLVIVDFLLFFVVVFFVILFELSLYELIVYYTLSQGLYALVCLTYLKEISLDFKIDLSNIKNILLISIFFMFNYVAFFLLTYIDRFLIKKYMTEYDLGIYTLSSSISLLVLGLISALLYSIIKTKINENIGSETALSNIKFFSNKSINIFAIPIIMGLLTYGYNFVVFYGGESFGQSYKYMVVLLITVYMNLLSYVYSEEYLLKDKENTIKKIFIINILALGINIVLNVISIPKYGLWGVAISSLIAYTIQFVSILYITKSLSLISNMIKYLVPALTVWGVGYCLWDNNYGFWLMWIYCIISMILYFGLIYILYNKDIKRFFVIARQINE